MGKLGLYEINLLEDVQPVIKSMPRRRVPGAIKPKLGETLDK